MFRNINVVLHGRDATLGSTLTRAGHKVDKFANKVTKANSGLTKGKMIGGGFAAAAVAVGIGLAFAASKAAAFESRMRNVNSISKLSETQLAALSSKTLALSRQVPQAATVLADGLYDIASSGFSGAEGLTVLEAAAYAASAGITDTAVSAKAITSVLNAYGLKAAEAGYVSDVLFQTVNYGVLTFEELASQLGDVVGMASAAGISIAEVGAAVAAMTLAGINAAESTTSLNRLIQALLDPSEDLAAVYQELGYQSGHQAIQAKGLHAVMEDLRKSTGGNVVELLKLFPEIRAARGAFALMAAEGRNYAKTSREIEDRQRVTGSTMAVFKEQTKALSAQLKILGNRVTASAIVLGTKMLPVIKSSIVWLERMYKRGLELVLKGSEMLRPAWQSLTKAFRSAVEVGREMLKVLIPLGKTIGMLVGGAVILGVTVFAEALEHLVGFLEDNEWAAKVLAIALGVKLVSALRATTIALATTARTGFGTFLLGLVTGTRKAIVAFQLMAVLLGGGVVGAARAATMAMGTFLTSNVGKATVLTGVLLGIANSLNQARDSGRKWAQDLRDSLDIDTSSLTDTRRGINALRDEYNTLVDQINSQKDIGGFFEATGDVILGMFGGDGLIDSYVDTWAKMNGITDDQLEGLEAQYEHMSRELVRAFDISGLGVAFARSYNTPIQLTRELASELERVHGLDFSDLEFDGGTRGGTLTGEDGPVEVQGLPETATIEPNDARYSAVAAQVGLLNVELETMTALANKADISLNGDFGGELGDLARKMAGLPPAAQETELAIEAIGNASEVGTDKVDALASALDKLLDGALGAEEAADAYQGAINNMIAASKETKNIEVAAPTVDDPAATTTESIEVQVDFKGATDAALGFRDAVRGVTDTIADQVQAAAADGAKMEELRAIIQFLTQDYYNNAVAVGVPAEKAAEYRDILRELPDEALVNFDPSAIDALIESAQDGKVEVEELDAADATPKVGADTSEWDTEFDKVIGDLRNLDGTRVQVLFGGSYQDSPNQGPYGRPPASSDTSGADQESPFGMADGGIMKRYADGGIEDDDAHITYRQRIKYGEPETGGEAYIPLTPLKRGRSTRILSEVARGFGYGLAPRGINTGVQRSEAGGSTTVYAPKTTSHTTHHHYKFGNVVGVSMADAERHARQRARKEALTNG